MGNRLHVCFIYIKKFTYEFIANHKFIIVVYAQVGYCPPLLTCTESKMICYICFFTYDIWLAYGICLVKRLHVYFIYINFFTYCFIDDHKFLLVVCTKVGYYSPILAVMTARLRSLLGSLGVFNPGSDTASPIRMTTMGYGELLVWWWVNIIVNALHHFIALWSKL